MMYFLQVWINPYSGEGTAKWILLFQLFVSPASVFDRRDFRSCRFRSPHFFFYRPRLWGVQWPLLSPWAHIEGFPGEPPPKWIRTCYKKQNAQKYTQSQYCTPEIQNLRLFLYIFAFFVALFFCLFALFLCFFAFFIESFYCMLLSVIFDVVGLYKSSRCSSRSSFASSRCSTLSFSAYWPTCSYSFSRCSCSCSLSSCATSFSFTSPSPLVFFFFAVVLFHYFISGLNLTWKSFLPKNRSQ